MSGKLALVVGGAVGYVLGTRAGRQRYDQIKDRAATVWSQPGVQDAVDRARQGLGKAVPATTRSHTSSAAAEQPVSTPAGPR